MKKSLFILFFSILTGISAFAQVEDPDDRSSKLQERMQQYIQARLNLTRNEAERFSPIFLRYIVELRRTHRENINDKPVLMLKIAEVRVRFRNEFKEVLDEQRANKVFDCQREFEIKIKTELENRRMENRPIRRNRSLLQ